MKYRPWGAVDWALSLSSQKQWQFVGAIGTEERSLCSWIQMRGRGCIAGELFAEIQDVDSEKYRDRTRDALDARRTEFIQNGGNLATIRSIELMAEWFRIEAFAREAEAVPHCRPGQAQYLPVPRANPRQDAVASTRIQTE